MRAPARLVWVALFIAISGGDFGCGSPGPSKALVSALKPLRVPSPVAGGFTVTEAGFEVRRETPVALKPGQRTVHLLGAPFLSTVDADSGAVTVRADEQTPGLTLKP